MTLLDIKKVHSEKEEIIADYEDREKWSKMMLINIAKADSFLLTELF